MINRLLAALPRDDRKRLLAHCKHVELSVADVLCEPGKQIRHAYFPTESFISMVTPIDGRASLEVGLIGDEGMLGSSLALGVNTARLHGLVLGSGHAWRIDAARFRSVLQRSLTMQRAMKRYLYVLMNQLALTAACTRFHVVEARLARWLLMTVDRAHTLDLHITHETLASMLGVRRVGITRAATSLRRRKLLRYSRGHITILDRRGLEAAACSCYAASKHMYAHMLN